MDREERTKFLTLYQCLHDVKDDVLGLREAKLSHNLIAAMESMASVFSTSLCTAIKETGWPCAPDLIVLVQSLRDCDNFGDLYKLSDKLLKEFAPEMFEENSYEN